MDYFLQKVCGKPARQAVTLRRCTPAEASAVFALQNEVRAAMPHPEQFVPDTLENITGLSAHRDMYRRMAATAAGRVPHPAPVRAEQ